MSPLNALPWCGPCSELRHTPVGSMTILVNPNARCFSATFGSGATLAEWLFKGFREKPGGGWEIGETTQPEAKPNIRAELVVERTALSPQWQDGTAQRYLLYETHSSATSWPLDVAAQSRGNG